MTLGTRLGRVALSAVDLSAASVAAAATVVGVTARRLRGHRRTNLPPTLLELEATYSLEAIRERGLEHEIRCRDLNGFFEHVWSVHPAVGASSEHSPESGVGRPFWTSITTRHTFVEGTVALTTRLASFPRLNFVLAQSRLLAQLSRLIQTQRISMIRVGDPYYLSLLGLILARSHGLPLVVRVNGNYDLIWESTRSLAYPRLFRWRWLEKIIVRYTLSQADLVAGGNENTRQFALSNGAHSERSTVFRAGAWVDPLHFEWEPADRPGVHGELDLTGRPFLILVSRLARLKHPEDVLSVLGAVKCVQPEVAGIFVGDGPMTEELEEAAQRMGLGGSVTFVGNRDQHWIARALTSASVVLSPLTGRALIEGCLSGRPVVAYDVDWHSELVRSGESGVLVPYRDSEAMAVEVCHLLADPGYAYSLAERARARTLEIMDPAKLRSHERDEYRKLLAVRQRPGSGAPLAVGRLPRTVQAHRS